METQAIENVNNNITHPPAILGKLLKMLRILLAFDPIMANIIAIALAFGILALLNHPALFPKLGKYHLYFTYIIYGLIVLQTIKSSTKSVLIPLIALCIAGLGITMLNIHPDCHLIRIEWLKELMLLGVIGIMTSIFVIR